MTTITRHLDTIAEQGERADAYGNAYGWLPLDWADAERYGDMVLGEGDFADDTEAREVEALALLDAWDGWLAETYVDPVERMVD